MKAPSKASPVYVPTNVTKAPAPIADRQPVGSAKPAPPQEAPFTSSESAPENNKNTHEEGMLLKHNHCCNCDLIIFVTYNVTILHSYSVQWRAFLFM